MSKAPNTLRCADQTAKLLWSLQRTPSPLDSFQEFLVLVLPALFHCLTNTLGVLFAIVFVKIRGFDVGRRGSIGVIQETKE